MTELKSCVRCNCLCDVPDVDMCMDCHNEIMGSSLQNQDQKIVD